MNFEHRLIIGHVARHTPPNSTISRSVALLDIAQDFLLSFLHAHDAFELVVFKGGTALRKFFAGAAGRFSTDLDFAIAYELRPCSAPQSVWRTLSRGRLGGGRRHCP